LKISVIDIGSNTIKLVNYDITRDNSFTAYQQESSKVRLGESLVHAHDLSEHSMLKAMDVLLLYRDIIKLESVRDVICIGTSALREAKNAESFIEQVYKKTGFKVKILTGIEEAYCSYLGASMSTCFADALYFDLGGGSLELVYTENFKLKRTDSLPLGALRLSEIYARKDGSFSKKDIEAMMEKIEETLPNRKTYGIGIDTMLVGSGGTLRALARYEQLYTGYPFEKIHNYRLTFDSIESIGKKLGSMKPSEISDLHAMDSTRAETVAAGTNVISTLMKQYNFSEIVVSAFGLREGVLASYLHNPEAFESRSNTQSLERQITQLVTTSCKYENQYFGLESLIHFMILNRYLKEREAQILSYALGTLTKLPPTDRVSTQFYLILDEIYPHLSHREQLVLALSIAYSKKPRIAEWLFYKHRSLLKTPHLKSIQKIGTLLKLGYLIIKARFQVMLKASDANQMVIDIVINQKSNSKILLQNIIQKVTDIFGIAIQYRLVSSANKPKGSDGTMLTLKPKL
jgi:exopolyphosphatase / guanosine-5'-triphosphate,3'-diphosphate pyrophosphatase